MMGMGMMMNDIEEMQNDISSAGSFRTMANHNSNKEYVVGSETSASFISNNH